MFYPPNSQHQQMKPGSGQVPQRERKTLAIVDPNTGKNILDDMNMKFDKSPTPPQSSESSASNTPAPVSS